MQATRTDNLVLRKKRHIATMNILTVKIENKELFVWMNSPCSIALNSIYLCTILIVWSYSQSCTRLRGCVIIETYEVSNAWNLGIKYGVNQNVCSNFSLFDMKLALKLHWGTKQDTSVKMMIVLQPQSKTCSPLNFNNISASTFKWGDSLSSTK